MAPVRLGVANGRVAEPTKVCGRCKHRKGWSDFGARRRWPDGTMRTPDSWCKVCRRGYNRKRYRENPAPKREAVRRRREEILSDPARREEFMARARASRAVWRRKQGMAVRKFGDGRLPAGERVRATVPIAPFREWLRGVVGDRPAGKREVAAIVGVDEKRVHLWLGGDQEVIELGLADRVLCVFGCPELVLEFWPVAGDELPSVA